MGNNQSNHFPHIPEKVTWSLNTIINGKSQTLLSVFFEDRGGCTQATKSWTMQLEVTTTVNPPLSPPGAYLFQAHLRIGLIETGGLFD